MTQQFKHFYEFGPFRLDLEERLLFEGGTPVTLAPKVFETLVLLIERGGRVVTKEEMMKALWPDRFVEEANLSQNIFVLRKALGEGQKVQYIETIPKRGYRFVAPVKEVQEEAPDAGEAAAPPAAPAAAEEPPPRRDDAATSLAVLPMVNESHDSKLEYFTTGITEEIINRLTELPRVRVVARSLVFRYKGQESDARKIGRELGVDAVLLSRLHMKGELCVVAAELFEVKTGWQLWSGRYELPFSDIMTVYDTVAEKISETLRFKFREGEQHRHVIEHTKDPEAYRAYLKGRYHASQGTAEGYQTAIDNFEEASRLDPSYALAYSGLADAYVAFDFYGVLPPWETSPKAKAAAINALRLDDTLAEAHTSLACVKMMYERDWSNAERAFKKAIELDPDYARAHIWYAHLLMALGRVEDSFAESNIALQLDPLDASINHYLGWHYMYARRFDRAVVQLEKTLADHPDFFLARVALAMAYEQKGDATRAVQEFQKALQMSESQLVRGFLGHAYAMCGKRDEALKVLRDLEKRAKRRYVPPYVIGLIYTALGEKPKAIEWLDKSFAAQNEWLNWINVAPEVDSLRSEPGFQDILRRLNFPKHEAQLPADSSP